MRAIVQRPLAFVVVALVVVLSGRVFAQSGQKSLSQYRLELEQAREELIQIYKGGTVAGSVESRGSVAEDLQRLQRENQRLYQAAVKYVEREDAYNRARGQLEPTTAPVTEPALNIPIEARALSNAQCAATTTTEYLQRNTVARVNSTIKIEECAAASGAFTVAVRVRDEGGEDKSLEFDETWQRSDDQDVKFAADYPIGENVELLNVRVRRLSCTCADPAQENPVD